MRNILFSLLMVLFAASASAQPPIVVSEQMLAKHRVKMVPPSYPLAAKKEHVSGTVVLRIVVSPAGDVRHVKLVSGPALLRSAAKSAVKHWKYRPFKQKGKAVAAAGDVNVIFILGSTSPRTPVEKFLGRVLPKYVREPGLVERGFSCQIDPKWREFPAVQLLPKNSPVRAWLQGTELRLVVKAKTMPTVTAMNPAKPELNPTELARARQIVGSVRQSQMAFSMSWLSLGIYVMQAVPDAKLQKTGDETEIKFGAHGTTIQAIFDKNLLLTRFSQQYPSGLTVNLAPHFEKTPQGLLYNGSDVAVEQSGREQHAAYALDYQSVGQFHLPKTVVETVSDGTVAVHFRYQDCEVNPPSSPTPQGHH